MAGKLFDITDDIRQVAKDGLDDMIDQFGKVCVLHFPITWTTDASAVVDPIGPKPGTIWETGMQEQESYDQVTDGKRATRQTAELKMLIRWNSKDFDIKPARGVVVAQGAIQTKVYQTDLPQIMRAEYMLVQASLKASIYLKFERDGGPVDPTNIVADRYAVINWKRIG